MVKKTGEIDKILGAKIFAARTAQDISRKTIADAIGITHQQIQKYEKGVNRISVSRLFEICNFLSINPTELLESATSNQSKPSICNSISAVHNEIMYYIEGIKDENKLSAIKNIAKAIKGN